MRWWGWPSSLRRDRSASRAVQPLPSALSVVSSDSHQESDPSGQDSVVTRAWRNVGEWGKQKRLQIPVILDLVGDRVFSRLHAVLLTVMVFMVIALAVLLPALHDPRSIRTTEVQVFEVRVVAPPERLLTITETMKPAPEVFITASDSVPLKGRRIRASARFVDWEILATDFEIVVDTLQWAEVSPVFLPELGGTLEVETNEKGIGTFTDLRFTFGFPDVGYELVFTCEGIEASVVVSLVGAASKIEISPQSSPPFAEFGVPLPIAPVVRVTPIEGANPEGKVVRLLSFSDVTPDDLLHLKLTHVENAQAVTNASGVAVFPNITVVSGSGNTCLLSFACEGIVAYWISDQAQTSERTRVLSHVASVTGGFSDEDSRFLQENGIVEGATLPPARVQVTGMDGKGLARKRVYAMISEEDGIELYYFLPLSQHKEERALMHAVSPPTDEDGWTTFDSLQFTTRGTGDYFRIAFLSESVASESSVSMRLYSSVVHIAIIHVDIAATAIDSSSSLSGRFTGVMRAENELGKGVSGKRGFVRVVNATGVVDHEEALTDGDGFIIFGELAFVVSPYPSFTHTIVFSADGIDSDLMPIYVSNVDSNSSTLCTHLTTRKEPSPIAIVQQPLDPYPEVQAVNSYGLPLEGVDVFLHADTPLFVLFDTKHANMTTDADGIVAMEGTTPTHGYENMTIYLSFTSSVGGYCKSQRFSRIIFENIVFNVTILQQPGNVNATHTPLSPGPVVLVQDVLGNPVEGALGDVTLFRWPTYIPEIDTSLLSNDIRVETGTKFMSGMHALSDAHGIMRFDNLVFEHGYPGTYSMAFLANGVFSIESHYVFFYSPVDRIEIVTPPSTTAVVGRALTRQPELRIVDNEGHGLKGYLVRALVLPSSAALIVASGSDPISDLSDEQGLITFTGLGFTAGSSGTYTLKFFFAHEDLLVMSEETEPIRVKNSLSSITVIQSGGWYAAPKTKFPNIVTIRINGDAKDILSNREVEIFIVQQPRGQVATLQGAKAKTNTDGEATFGELMIRQGPEGEYILGVRAAGIESSDKMSIVLSTRATICSLLTGVTPPDVVGIDELFTSAAYVAVASGAPLRGKKVTAVFVKDAGNGRMHPRSLEAISQSDGIARFEMAMTSGVEGEYSFVFRADNAYSEESRVFKLVNPVGSVIIERQPPSRHTVGDVFPVDEAPIVRVLGKDGKPLGGFLVHVTLKRTRNAVLTVAETDYISDADGRVTLLDIGFLTGTTATYNFVFVVSGVESESSRDVRVTNLGEPDPAALGTFSHTTYLFGLLFVPVFFCASDKRSWKPVVCGLAVPIVFLISAISGLDTLADNQDLYNRSDGFQASVLAVFLLVSLALLLAHLWVLSIILRVSFFKKGSESLFATYNEERLARFTSLLRNAVPFGAKRFFATQEQLRWTVPKPAVLVYSRRNRASTSYSSMWDAVRQQAQAATGSVLSVFSLRKKAITPEEERCFFYPLRFLCAFGISALVTFLCLIGTCVGTLWINQWLDARWAELVSVQVRASNELRTYVDSRGFDSTGSLIEAAENVSETLGPDSRLVMIIRELTNLDRHDVNALQDAVLTSGVLSASLVSIFVLLSWGLMFRSYRRQALLMRKGQHEVDKTRYTIISASNYIGLQVMHCLVGFMFFWFVLGAVLFFLFWHVSRHFLADKTVGFVIGFISGTFAVKLAAKLIARLILTSGFLIRHQRIHALYDFAWIFLGMISGLVDAIIRFFVSIALNLLYYMRLDQPLVGPDVEHLDVGYASFMSMLIADQFYNNPTAVVFFQILKERLAVIRKREEDKKVIQCTVSELQDSITWGHEAQHYRSEQVRFRWNVLITLHNNPSIRTRRKKRYADWKREVDERALEHEKEQGMTSTTPEIET